MSSLTRSILAALALVFFSAWGQGQSELRPYDYGFDAAARIERRQHRLGERVVIRGAAVRDNRPLVARPEIRELENNSTKWTLYLLGLSMMQFTNQTTPTSWYGIAGIHSVPFAVWSGVEHLPGQEGWPYGYCAHSNIKFPTWHRPFLALFEQVLFDHVQEIASWWSETDDRDLVQAAAAEFRIPYWDWAAAPPGGESVLPLSVGVEYVVVSGPNGNQTISNPLFSYSFKPLDTTAFHLAPWNQWTTTLRSPTPPRSPSAQSNNSAIAANLDVAQSSFQARVYNLFSTYDNYSQFTTEIESLHNDVHAVSGGLNGHMYFIPFSAFDPLFFIHHAMVDRLFALWQVLNPNSWLVPSAAAVASATTFKGEIEDGSTGLAPFIAGSNGSLWSSDMIRDPGIFGYTYKEISGASFSEPDAEMQKKVIAEINRLYGSSSIPEIVKSSGHGAGSLMVGNNYREWVANIRVDRQALDQSFAIHLFLGRPPLKPDDWTTAPNHVGFMGVFAQLKMGNTDSLSHIITGTVPLTERLARRVEYGLLANLDPAVIKPFLKANLQAHVLSADGYIYDVRSIPSLRIQVASALVEAPTGETELPSWGEVVSHFDLI